VTKKKGVREKISEIYDKYIIKKKFLPMVK